MQLLPVRRRFFSRAFVEHSTEGRLTYMKISRRARHGLYCQASKLKLFVRRNVATRSKVLGVNWFEEGAKKCNKY